MPSGSSKGSATPLPFTTYPGHMSGIFGSSSRAPLKTTLSDNFGIHRSRFLGHPIRKLLSRFLRVTGRLSEASARLAI